MGFTRHHNDYYYYLHDKEKLGSCIIGSKNFAILRVIHSKELKWEANIMLLVSLSIKIRVSIEENPFKGGKKNVNWGE